MEIEMDSENESQLKRIRKPPLLLSQEESLAEKVKKYPCLFDKCQKTYKERDVFQKFSLHKIFALFSRLDYFFRSFKNKNNMSGSWASIWISAK